MTAFATEFKNPFLVAERVPKPLRAAAVDGMVAANRAKTPQAVADMRAAPRLSIAELNDLDFDDIRKRMGVDPLDTRGPVQRVLDIIDLPRNALFNLVAPSIAKRKKSEGDFGTFGMGSVSFGDVLDELGVENRLIRGVGGLAGDIAFDPLSWAGPLGWLAKGTTAANRTIVGSRRMRKLMDAGVKAAAAGVDRGDDVARITKAYGFGPDAVAAMKAEGKTEKEIRSLIKEGTFGSNKQKYNKALGPILGQDKAYDGGRVWTDSVEDVVDGVTDAARKEQIEAAKQFVSKYGRDAVPGVRFGKRASTGKYGVEVSGYGAGDIQAGSTIAHIPFTDIGIHVPKFTDDAEQALAVGALARSGEFVGDAMQADTPAGRMAADFESKVGYISDDINSVAETLKGVNPLESPEAKALHDSAAMRLNELGKMLNDEHAAFVESVGKIEAASDAPKSAAAQIATEKRVRAALARRSKLQAQLNKYSAGEALTPETLAEWEKFHGGVSKGAVARADEEKAAYEAAFTSETAPGGRGLDTTDPNNPYGDGLGGVTSDLDPNPNTGGTGGAVLPEAPTTPTTHRARFEAEHQAAFNQGPEVAKRTADMMEAFGRTWQENLGLASPDEYFANIKARQATAEDLAKLTPEQQLSRGAMVPTDDGDLVILALTNHDASTPIHELGHVFNRQLRQAAPELADGADQWVRGKYGDQGFDPNTGDWTVTAMEDWARSFERYVRDGEAPPGLAGVFQKFKRWLLDVVQSFTGDEQEVRRIFKRMLGAEPEALPQVRNGGKASGRVNFVNTRKAMQNSTGTEMFGEEASSLAEQIHHGQNNMMDGDLLVPDTVRGSSEHKHLLSIIEGLPVSAARKKQIRAGLTVLEPGEKRLGAGGYDEFFGTMQELGKDPEAVLGRLLMGANNNETKIPLETLIQINKKSPDPIDRWYAMVAEKSQAIESPRTIQKVRAEIKSAKSQLETTAEFPSGTNPETLKGKLKADFNKRKRLEQALVDGEKELDELTAAEAAEKAKTGVRPVTAKKLNYVSPSSLVPGHSFTIGGDSVYVVGSGPNAHLEMDGLPDLSIDYLDGADIPMDPGSLKWQYKPGTTTLPDDIPFQQPKDVPGQEGMFGQGNVGPMVGKQRSMFGDMSKDPVPDPRAERPGIRKGETIAAYDKRIGLTDTPKMFDEGTRPQVERNANTEDFSKEYALRKPIKGTTGSEIVGYKWQSEIVDGMFRDRRVSDWSRAQISEPTGRQIVHLFWVRDPSGDTKLMGVGAAKKALGIAEDRLRTIAKREQAIRQADEMRWDSNERSIFKKDAHDTAEDADRRYKQVNDPDKMMWGTPDQRRSKTDEMFKSSKLLTKEGKFLRTGDTETIEQLAKRGWSGYGEQPPATGTTPILQSAPAKPKNGMLFQPPVEGVTGPIFDGPAQPFDYDAALEKHTRNVQLEHEAIIGEEAARIMRLAPAQIKARELTADGLGKRVAAAKAAALMEGGSLISAMDGKDRLAMDTAKYLLGYGPSELGYEVFGPMMQAALGSRDDELAQSIYDWYGKSAGNVREAFGHRSGRLHELARSHIRASRGSMSQAEQMTSQQINRELDSIAAANGVQADQRELMNDVLLAMVLRSQDPTRPLFHADSGLTGALADAVNSGLFTEQVNPGLAKAMQAMADRWAGTMRAQLDQSTELFGTRALDGAYGAGNQTTPEAAQLIRVQKNALPSQTVTEAKGPKRDGGDRVAAFQKPRSTIRYQWTDTAIDPATGEEVVTNHDFTDYQRYFAGMTADDIAAMGYTPDELAEVGRIRNSIARFDKMGPVEKAQAGLREQYMDPWQINNAVKNNHALRGLLGVSDPSINLMETDFAKAAAARTGQQARKLTSRILQEAIADIAVPVNEMQLSQVRNNKDLNEIRLANGTKARFIRGGKDGKDVLVIGGQRFRKVNPENNLASSVDMLDGTFGNTKAYQSWLPEKAAELLENASVPFKDENTINKTLKAIDEFTAYWKATTLGHASWTIGNIIGSITLAMRMRLDPVQFSKHMKTATQLALAQNDPEKLAKLTFEVGNETMNGMDYLNGPLRDATMQSGFYGMPEAMMLSDGTIMEAPKTSLFKDPKKAIREISDTAKRQVRADANNVAPNTKAGRAWEKVKIGKRVVADEVFMRRMWGNWAKINSKPEDAIRIAAALTLMDQGHDATNAARMIREHMFDFADLTHFESHYLRRLMPFYSWMKNSGQHTVRMLIQDPKYSAMFPKLKEAIEESIAGDDAVPESMRPSWMREQMALQVGRDPDNRFAIMMSSLLPNETGIRMASGALSPFIGGDALQDAVAYLGSSVTPLVKMAGEITAGREFFSGRTIGNAGEADLSRSEWALGQVRPFRELGIGSIRQGPLSKAFAESPLQGAARLVIGGRSQPFDAERVEFSRIKEFNELVEGVRRRINIAERENNPEASLQARVKLMKIFAEMKRSGLESEVPAWAREQVDELSSVP